MLNILDFVILGLIAFSGIVSIFRGFVREILALITWAVAVWVAWHFGAVLCLILEPYVQSKVGRYLLAYGGLFVLTMIIGGLVNYLFSQLVDKSGLGATDRTLGLLFGLLRGILIISVMLLVMQLTPVIKEPWWHQSRLVPLFVPIEAWLKDLLPKEQRSNFEMRNDTP
jgi:membrane protein required for colicin V production